MAFSDIHSQAKPKVVNYSKDKQHPELWLNAEHNLLSVSFLSGKCLGGGVFESNKIDNGSKSK